MGLFSFFSKEKKETLDKGLETTKKSFFSKLSRSIVGKSTVDAEVLDDLEEVLISSDVGVNTTLKIIERIEERIARDKYVSTSELQKVLREEIAELLEENNTTDLKEIEIPKVENGPYVIMVVGVNGVGKTTTIGKLAHQIKSSGKTVAIKSDVDNGYTHTLSLETLCGRSVSVNIVGLTSKVTPDKIKPKLLISALSC